MLIYNKDSVDNLNIQKRASRWLRSNFITKDEFTGICSQYSSAYHDSSFWARAGMFIFTIIIISSATSLLSIGAFGGSTSAIAALFIFYGIIYYAFAEFFTRSKNHFRSGVTDALLYSSVLALSIGIIILLGGDNFNSKLDPIIYQLCLLPIFVFTAVRFADSFLALLSYGALFTINAMLFLKMGTLGESLLPFEAMALSYLAYFLSKKLKVKEDLRYWKRPLFIIEIASIVSFYASGNYYVVRQLTESMLHVEIPPGGDIQLSFFFYAFTILVPLIYVWRGLKQKDYTLIRLGVILEVAGILAIRYYHSIMPVETAMIAGGILLVVIAWLSINYLKTPKHGLTYFQNDDRYDEAISAISSVLISQTGKDLQNAVDGKEPVFSGGSSGGGGAGGSF